MRFRQYSVVETNVDMGNREEGAVDLLDLRWGGRLLQLAYISPACLLQPVPGFKFAFQGTEWLKYGE